MKLVISNTDIHQDAEGRYSLNDLHKAAGGEDRHRPNYFLENDQTKRLIATLMAERDAGNPASANAGFPAVKTREGRYGGSYACKEIVYAYAMWISPGFHIQVIRTFDEVATGRFVNDKRTLEPTIGQQLTAHGIRIKLLDKLEAETHPEKRVALHAQLDHASQILGLSTPAIETIGQNADPDHESPILEEFWELFEHLQHAGYTLNHARDKELIAINLPQVRKAAAEEKLALPDMLMLRRLLRACFSPRFVALKAVNSAITADTVKCWVFQQE